MTTLDEAAGFTLALPGVEEADRRGMRTWRVGDKVFAWERAFSKADVRRFGDDPVPDGPILAVRTADLQDKEAVLAAGHRGVFTIPHFDGFSAVLVQVDVADARVVRELVTDAWLATAPPALVADFTSR